MSGEPSNSQVLAAVHALHGDVKVALDRTVTHSVRLDKVEGAQTNQGLEIARARGQATILGGLASLAVTGLLTLLRSMGGGGHSP